MNLLDVNVLIALGDASHVHHRRGRAWFLSKDCDAWATCPITENGLIRILGQEAYPDFEGGQDDARDILSTLASVPGHQFWSDDPSLRDSGDFPRLSNSRHLTDLYLLALAPLVWAIQGGRTAGDGILRLHQFGIWLAEAFGVN